MASYNSKNETILKHLVVVVMITYSLGSTENLKKSTVTGSNKYVSIDHMTGAMYTFANSDDKKILVSQRLSTNGSITDLEVSYTQTNITSVHYGKLIDDNNLALIVTKDNIVNYVLQIHKFQSGNPASTFSSTIMEQTLGPSNISAPSFDIDSFYKDGNLFIAAAANGYISGKFDFTSSNFLPGL
jgi:hypothetical protein